MCPDKKANGYSLEEHKQNSLELYDVMPYVMDGAVHYADTKTEWTKAEMEEAIANFLNKRVV